MVSEADQPPVGHHDLLRLNTVLVWATLLAACGDQPTEPPPATFEIGFVRGDSAYLMKEDGSNIRPLAGAERRMYWPSLSPDGRHLVYETTANEIFVTDVTSGSTNQLGQSGVAAFSPAWSPDGTEIAYITMPHPGGPPDFELNLVNPDGTNIRNLGTGPYAGFGIAWAPDRSRLITTVADFSSPSFPLSLAIVQLPSGQLGPALPIAGSSYAPSWSPDGSMIAFAILPPAGQMTEIWVSHPDGSAARRLTTAPTTGHRDDTTPQWSPHGRKILFIRVDAGSGFVALMTADGVLEPMTERRIEAHQAFWKPRQ
jgi:Tol biopolymer transport system component